jgi:serine/threonine-protein kinase/endoribonuclease IRE1
MVLSDFGLAKRLDAGQSSYMQTGNHAVGTTGWLAPECLTGEVDLDQGFEGSSSRHSRYTDDDGPKRLETAKPKHGRLTRAVDLFALGCVYYYVITSGGHPYGGRYDRDRNIIRDEKNLSALDSYGEDGYEAKALITKLLSPDAKQR